MFVGEGVSWSRMGSIRNTVFVNSETERAERESETKGKNGEESEWGRRKEGRGESQRDRAEGRKEEGERPIKEREEESGPPWGLELQFVLITHVSQSCESNC